MQRIFSFTCAIILSLSAICYSQEVAEMPVAKTLEKAEVLEFIKELANEDLTEFKHPEKPALWKVEGNGLKKASYLFGSLHVSDANITTLNPVAEAAYQQADTLATEVNMNFFNQVRAVAMMTRKDKQTLKQAIGDDLYEELNTQLNDIDPSLSAKLFNNLKTWAVMITFSMIEEQMNAGESKILDTVLWDRAGKDEKKRWTLETLDEQLGGLDLLTKEEQNTLLKESLILTKMLNGEGIKIVSLFKNLYLKGNIDSINLHLENLGKIQGYNEEVNMKFYKILLSDRNDRMAAKIHDTFVEMPEKSHFIVAGALHFLGEHNVADLLRKQGYTVTSENN